MPNKCFPNSPWFAALALDDWIFLAPQSALFASFLTILKDFILWRGSAPYITYWCFLHAKLTVIVYEAKVGTENGNEREKDMYLNSHHVIYAVSPWHVARIKIFFYVWAQAVHEKWIHTEPNWILENKKIRIKEQCVSLGHNIILWTEISLEK